jgi:DNA-binding NarL/FixJ family response regulator
MRRNDPGEPARGAVDTTRALVVDDNFYTRLGTVSFLRSQSGLEVVGDAATGEAGLALFDALRPDITIVELRMPGMDGVQLTAALCGRRPQARVLVLSLHDGEEDVFRALQAGARGYLTKRAPASQLVAGIATVRAGGRFFPPAIAERLASRMLAPSLTGRERTVLAHAARGATNREIAACLRLAERTVGLYMSSVLGKLGARTRTGAAAIARQRGIISDE